MKWYKYDIRDLSDAEYSKWYSLLSKDKQIRADGFRFEDDKKRTVAGEMLARKAISEWCNVAPESIVFDKTKHGKPFAKDLDVEFNVSHSGDIVVCAIDNEPTGIDIELIRPVDLKVAKRIFNDNELEYLFGKAPDDADFCKTTDNEIISRFFELWTKKEACAKCMGTGIFTEDIKDLNCMENADTFNLNNYIVSVFCR